ncbi:MAG TPA: AAA family ATPase [Candidatus Paceibacterota bacterium]
MKSSLLNSTALKNQIPKFVLTGGPCAGKTTAREYLKEKLKDYGFTPFFVPEIPTEFIENGIAPNANGFTRDQFQELLFEEVLDREARYMRMAYKSSADKKILICDRGLLDVRAYSDTRQFDFWLDKKGLSLIGARDTRYDAVFHLVTAAQGAEEFYTLANNKARSETLEEARERDGLVFDAWNGHPHLRIIDNSTDFEGKMRRLLGEVCHALGVPVPLEIERKFLIHPPAMQHFRKQAQVINIEQAYLAGGNDGITRRVRKREQSGACMFVETNKQMIRDGVRAEVEWPISQARYLAALAYEQDPNSVIVRKKRTCFQYKNQYFELDYFEEPHQGLWLLEIELTDIQQEISLPPFLDIIKEVTNDSAFTNSELAKKR